MRCDRAPFRHPCGHHLEPSARPPAEAGFRDHHRPAERPWSGPEGAHASRPDRALDAGRMTGIRLGADQLVAAAIGGGPIRVVAGAGTGKTAVIAERFRRLVAAGVSPSSILVMTFTERAAAEMRQRIEDLIDDVAPSVGTFHSIALGWLRADGKAVGVPPGFRILTGADRWILTRELMWQLGDAALAGDERPDDLVAPALQMLERMKQELVPLGRLAAWAPSSDDAERGELMRACVRLFRAYEKECKKSHLLDFEDLLVLTVKMLETHQPLLDKYTARFLHVLVYEYQDLNLAQERLVELIAFRSQPFVVGDDDQSTYRFRGASRASLERFRDRFPDAKTITIGRNRRSSRRIVSAAATLIANNNDRLPKQLQSNAPGAQVEQWLCPDGATEAAAIATHASALVERGTSPHEIAVLCRTNAIARPIASALAARGLPHVVIGGDALSHPPQGYRPIPLLRGRRGASPPGALPPAATPPPPCLPTPSPVVALPG